MMAALLNQVLEVVSTARTELAFFCLAFVAHHLLFGNAFPRYSKGGRVGREQRRPCREAAQEAVAEEGEEGEEEACPWAAGGEAGGQGLRSLAAAYQRGDHRGVLRHWSSLKRSPQVPAERLAHVVESMQRFKKDGSAIVAEVRSYLKRTPSLCTTAYVNRLLEPLARSLDTEVVLGIVEFLPSLELQADGRTYDILVQMHFTTRSFEEVSQLAREMTARGVEPSRRTSLALLKTALQLGRLDEALLRYQEVTAGCPDIPTASVAPRHIAQQLVELACHERRPEAVLAELEARRMPLTTETMNALLTECLRSRDQALARQVERLGIEQGVERSSRTYGLLVRSAMGDCQRILALLGEIEACGTDCVSEVSQAVLAACAASKDVALADRLCGLLRPEQAGQVPSLLALIRFYAEAGQPQKACKLYDSYAAGCGRPCGDERRRTLLDARTEKCLVAAALQCDRRDLATALLEASPADTARHIALIRGCAARGNLEEAMTTFQALEASGAELTHSLWNTALDACVECRDLRRAEGLMQRMEAAKVADVVSFNTLIKAHLRQENYDRARALMEEMRRAGCAPNHVTYNELINALVRSERELRRSQAVWDVVEEMRQSGVRPNRITCSILLKSLKAKSSHADVMRTMELTDNMEEPMDEVLLSSVVEACVRVGKPALLAQKLEQVQGAISVTGAHTFGSLIRAYGYVKDIAGAWRCWKEMRSQHVRPTSITIGCMAEAVVSNGDVDGGYELISGLLEDPQCRDQVNAVVFGSLLKGYGRARCMGRVWAVFEEMLSRGIEPSVVTYNAVVDACARNGQMDRVPELLEGMRSRNLEPNLITYSTMIKGFCQGGDMPAAFAVLEELRKGLPESRPDEVVFNTLLDGCAQAGLASEGERLLREMQAHGIVPSNYTLTVMVKLMGQSRRIDRAFELVETIAQKYRFRLNAHVCGALIQACLAARDPLRAAGAYDRAVRDRLQLEPRTCQNLVRSLLNAGHTVKSVSLLRAMLGLNGGAQPTFASERCSCGPAFDDTFLNEVLVSLMGSDDCALAPVLFSDLKAARPRMRIDAATERKLASYARKAN